MTAPSVGIKDILVAAGIAKYEGVPSGAGRVPVFISIMPDTPDTVIAVYDTGGLASDPKWLLNFPGVMVQVRAMDYLTGYNLINACKVALLGKYPEVLNGDRWDSITAIGDIASLGREEKNRVRFTSNYRLIIEPAAAVGDNRQAL